MCVCVCVCVIEYYSAIKKNEILPFETTWMDLKGIMLSEIRKTKKNTVRFHLYKESKTNKQNKTKTESWKQIPRGWLPEGRGMRMGGKGDGEYSR